MGKYYKLLLLSYFIYNPIFLQDVSGVNYQPEKSIQDVIQEFKTKYPATKNLNNLEVIDYLYDKSIDNHDDYFEIGFRTNYNLLPGKGKWCYSTEEDINFIKNKYDGCKIAVMVTRVVSYQISSRALSPWTLWAASIPAIGARLLPDPVWALSSFESVS